MIKKRVIALIVFTTLLCVDLTLNFITHSFSMKFILIVFAFAYSDIISFPIIFNFFKHKIKRLNDPIEY